MSNVAFTSPILLPAGDSPQTLVDPGPDVRPPAPPAAAPHATSQGSSSPQARTTRSGRIVAQRLTSEINYVDN